jgi:hypothetical protein
MKTPKIETSTTTLTPRLAAEWLATTGQQRAVVPHVVKKYAAQMKQGLWRFNCEPIIFDTDGKMIDGQHRCLAVINSGMPIDCLVVKGAPPEAFQSLNQGCVRNGATVLSILGVSNYKTITAILNVIHRINTGTQSTRSAVPNTLIEKLWQEYPDAATAAQYIAGNKFLRCHFPCGWVGAIWVFGSRQHGLEVARKFFEQLILGTNLPPTSPIWVLREKAIAWTSAKAMLSEQDKAGMMIKAWNAYVTGRPLKLLRYNRKGDQREEFPTIQ